MCCIVVLPSCFSSSTFFTFANRPTLCFTHTQWNDGRCFSRQLRECRHSGYICKLAVDGNYLKWDCTERKQSIKCTYFSICPQSAMFFLCAQAILMRWPVFRLANLIELEKLIREIRANTHKPGSEFTKHSLSEQHIWYSEITQNTLKMHQTSKRYRNPFHSGVFHSTNTVARWQANLCKGFRLSSGVCHQPAFFSPNKNTENSDNERDNGAEEMATNFRVYLRLRCSPSATNTTRSDWLTMWKDNEGKCLLFSSFCASPGDMTDEL